MNPSNNKILVRVDMGQKNTMIIGGVEVKCANNYATNYREKSPVIAMVVKGNAYVKEGDILLCHHNSFYQPSPYYLQDDLFAIPAGRTLFCIVKEDGSLNPIYGNTICTTVDIETPLPVPDTQKKKHLNRALVVDGGITEYKRGDLILHRPSAWYEIVYMWGGVETRVVKVHEDQICGVIRNYRKSP